MQRYQLPGYRPAGIAIHRPQMGQPAVRAAVGVSSLLVAALGAGTAWIGYRAGKRERGTMQVVAYSVSVFGALIAASGITGILGSFVSPVLSGKTAQA